MRKTVLLFAGVAAFQLGAFPAHAQRDPRTRPLPAHLTAKSLEKFASEAELRRYIRDVRREARKRDLRGALDRPIQLAQFQDVPPCTDPEECPLVAEDSQIVVSGARAAKPVSITNVQEAGVDEGDIVKQVGDHLLVLQDGRIFSIDTRGGLRLADRANVYRSADSGTWYDEMLVQGSNVLITGYSYDEDATELAVFSIDAAGKLASKGVFLLSSNDYYDTDNYATRLVGDALVVYTPLALSDLDPDKPLQWPMIRRWLPEEAREQEQERKQRGHPILDARSVYKPLQPTLDPVIHTVSVCPLAPVGKGRDLRCRATAVIGPARREFYVTPTDVYLWVTPGWNEYSEWSHDGDCDEWRRRGASDAHPAMLYRVPVSGNAPTALAAKGVPFDQFSFDASGGRFRALLGWTPIRCGVKQVDDEPTGLHLLDVPVSMLSAEPLSAPRGAYTPLPPVGEEGVENRFTDRYLVYGGRGGWGSWPPDANDPPAQSRAVAVPLRDPRAAIGFAVPHRVMRLERAGDDVMLSGYRDSTGLSVSWLDLSVPRARLGPPLQLAGRYESEGRSHAFNSLIEEDGHGLFGIPTVDRGNGGWAWRSAPSDVSFFSVDRARSVAQLGELRASPRDKAVHPDYICEVSCIDWYGNSRPIFTDGRVFALSGTELVEGRVESGRIAEIRRLNLSQPIGPARPEPG